MTTRLAKLTVLSILAATAAFAQANGKLQIHFMDVGQGDGALVISPQGATVLFDGGNAKDCQKPVSYLGQLGINRIDYMIMSHYHSDHLGCTADILAQSPLKNKSYDRGGSYNSKDYKEYVTAVGNKRTQAQPGQVITLDDTSKTPVRITFVAENGNGVRTTNENDLSVVALIEYGQFRAEIGGDLSGYNNNSYKDIETSVVPLVGQIDVYKVHHHCSAYSTNEAWLAATKPTLAIVSVGSQNNDYGHPTQECLERLHNAGVKAYWTEIGKGASPDPDFDIIAGNIVIQTDAAANPQTYTVTDDEGTTTVAVRGTATTTTAQAASTATPPSATPPRAPVPKYAWSKGSSVYHLATCKYVSKIAADNLKRSDTPPASKTLHQNCPQ